MYKLDPHARRLSHVSGKAGNALLALPMSNSGSDGLEGLLKVAQLRSGNAGTHTQAMRCRTQAMFIPTALPLLLPLRGKPHVGKGPGSHSPPLGRSKLWRQEGGAGTGWELLGSFSRAGEMPPIQGPLGEGEETAVYSSGSGKVMGEKAAIVCLQRVGAGSLSPRTLCSSQAPRPSLRKPCLGGGE